MRTLTMNRKGIVIIVFGAATFVVYLTLFRGTAEAGKTEGLRDFKDDKIKRRRTQDKIDSDGHYVPYYGYSTNANVVDHKKCLLIEEYIRNSKTLSRFISPLPASSYHVTIFEIFSQRDVPDKYKPKSGTVPSVHWSRSLTVLKNDLMRAQKKCDLISEGIEFRPEKLTLRPSVLVAYGTLSNLPVISKLRQELRDIFQKHKDQIFHMSLGYIYNPNISEKDMEEFNRELEGLWKLVNQSFVLHPPLVLYYETMEEFIPFTKAGLIQM